MGTSVLAEASAKTDSRTPAQLDQDALEEQWAEMTAALQDDNVALYHALFLGLQEAERRLEVGSHGIA